MKVLKILIFSLAALCLSGSVPSLHAEQFDKFKQYVTKINLKPFAKDLGGLIGAGSFHSGRSLGFPGVDVAGHAAVQAKPSKKNLILVTAKEDNLAVGFAQGEIGLPYKIDVILRGTSFGDSAIVGGGLRYGILRPKLLPFVPSLSISGFSHVMSHTFFSAVHSSVNLTLSVSMPFIQPYIGGGMDFCKVKIKESNTATLVGYKIKEEGARGTAGINIKLFPLTYFHAAYTNFHGQDGYEGGIGFKL
ncbi:hypothetical protein ACFL6Y_02865 [Elusimicrobiota bacterium]